MAALTNEKYTRACTSTFGFFANGFEIVRDGRGWCQLHRLVGELLVEIARVRVVGDAWLERWFDLLFVECLPIDVAKKLMLHNIARIVGATAKSAYARVFGRGGVRVNEEGVPSFFASRLKSFISYLKLFSRT